MASNTFQLENSQIQTYGCKEIDRLVWAGSGRFHELHNLGTSDLLQCSLLGVHSGSLPLERRRSSWHRHPQNTVHSPGQVWIGIEAQRRRRRHLCEIRQQTWRVMIYNIPGSVPRPPEPAGPSRHLPTSGSCGRYLRTVSLHSAVTTRGVA